jgi:glyoxylase-like metal-dependent hydrolase (beta-lactamase superfamily II)
VTFPPGPLVESRQVGNLRVHAIQAGGQRLDGGAMFGVVPKPLWERRIPADPRNRIQLGMRCLLIEHPSGLVLIDTGAGNKENEKFHDIYGVENHGENDMTQLEDGLRDVRVQPSDVSIVINTHLHFDHAGGNTTQTADGRVVPTFPHAKYVVQAGEYEFATHTNERTAASYFPHNFVPVHEAGLFELVKGEKEIVKGITVVPTPGHVPHHQAIKIESDGQVAFYVGDLSPTVAHLPLPWIMGYDLQPLVTLETKRKYFEQALREDWLIVFEHDAMVPWGHLVHDGKAYGLAEAR